MKLKDIYIRDPFILCHNNIYYMYGKEYLEQRGFVVYKSNDLTEWSNPQAVFMPDSNFWAEKEFWAPEVHYYNNKFYMIASFKSETRRRGSQILVSDAPDGVFKPVTEFSITPADWEALDGTLHIDRFGKPHLVFCHEWEQGGDGSVCEMTMSDDLTNPVTEPRILWYASDYKNAIDAFSHTKSLVTDGPFMYRTKNGNLICIWSTFTQYGYSVIIARSDNGDIDGKWDFDSMPMLEVDGGHGMIFKTIDNRVMLTMHSPNIAGLERAKIYEFLEDEEGEIRLRVL